MPCEVKPRFVLLYGSQKGQAQSIAEGVAEEAGEHGLVAELSCLDQSDKVAILHIMIHLLVAQLLKPLFYGTTGADLFSQQSF